MEFNNLIVEQKDSILTIFINRPNQLNALNIETIAELHKAFSTADLNDDIRVIVITGS